MTERTALYRLFADQHRLLYVGISARPAARFSQHAGDKDWWPEVCAQAIHWYPTREAALAAELQAIRSERPVHNKAGVLSADPEGWRPRIKWASGVAQREQEALERAVAAARLDGHTFREIGAWTEMNHESARKICLRINGHTQTRKEREERQP